MTGTSYDSLVKKISKQITVILYLVATVWHAREICSGLIYIASDEMSIFRLFLYVAGSQNVSRRNRKLSHQLGRELTDDINI